MTDTFANHTGYTERQNILARVSSLAGGRIFDGKPSDEQLQKAGGQVKPYAVVMFGRPIPASGDRGMGVGEESQPYIMAATFACIASIQDDAARLAAKITELLIGWLPNGDNAAPMKGAGGFSYQHFVAASMPARFEEQASFETTINLSPS